MNTKRLVDILNDNPEKRDIILNKGVGNTAEVIQLRGKVGNDMLLELLLAKESLGSDTLHELACSFASSVVDPCDLTLVRALQAKRAWVRGEITRDELTEARFSALDKEVNSMKEYHARSAVMDACQKDPEVAALSAAMKAGSAAFRYDVDLDKACRDRDNLWSRFIDEILELPDVKAEIETFERLGLG